MNPNPIIASFAKSIIKVVFILISLMISDDIVSVQFEVSFAVKRHAI